MREYQEYVDQLESEYLKSRIQKIQDKKLDEAEEYQRVLTAIHRYEIGVYFLRFFLSLVTLFIIWPIYNRWAKANSKSTWFQISHVDEIKKCLSKPLANDKKTSLESHGKSSEESIYESVSPSGVALVDSEQANTTRLFDTVESEMSSSVVIKRNAATSFIGEGGPNNDQRKFETWYTTDSVEVLLQIPYNWSQSLRVVFIDHPGDDNTHTFVQQVSHVITLSNEFDRPVIFVAKQPGISIHIIGGIYVNNTLLIIDPMGSLRLYQSEGFEYVVGQIQAQHENITIAASQTVIQHDKDFEINSCGPITTELLMHLITNFSRAQLVEFMASIQPENKSEVAWTDIDALLPASLKEIAAEKFRFDYEKKVVAVRKKHYHLILDAVKQDQTNRFSMFPFETADQTLKTYIEYEGSMDDQRIRDSYNKLAAELGCPLKRDSFPKDCELRKIDLAFTQEIAKGVQGKVYKYEGNMQTTAIKLTNENKEESYYSEVRILQKINHANVVKMIAHEQRGTRLCLQLEYAELGSLSTLINTSESFPPNWNIRFQIAIDIGNGLDYCHQHRILHCDTKPGNILIAWREGRMVAKIADFGFSITKKDSKNFCTGTLMYRAPVIFAYMRKYRDAVMSSRYRHEDLSPNSHSEYSDVYSLGVVLWELGVWKNINPRDECYNNYSDIGKFIVLLISGKRVEKTEDIRHEGLAQLVGRCWKMRYDQRPTASEVVEVLKGF